MKFHASQGNYQVWLMRPQITDAGLQRTEAAQLEFAIRLLGRFERQIPNEPASTQARARPVRSGADL
jgi:hypothetical protein